MKKVTKLLSVFLIAGAVGTGVAGISACSNKTPEHTHTAATEWQSDENGHWHNCTADDGVKLDEGAHVYDNDQDATCNTCGYERTVTPPAPQGYVVPAGTDNLVIEGVTEEVTLSTTNTSHTIDKSAIKVYLSAKGVKGTEVPAANYDLELYLNGETKITEWSGLKQDADYVVVAVLKDAVDESGKAVELEGEITVTVNNALVSLALKAGTTTQVQGANTMTADWTFEATRANGDKEDIAAADVEIGTLDTNAVGENKTVTISLKANPAVAGTVTYSITADTSKVAQSYVLSFGTWTATQKAAIPSSSDESPVVIDDVFTVVAGKGEIATGNTEGNNLFFNTRLKFGGKSDAKELDKQRYIKVTAADAGTLTIYAYSNTGTAPADGAAPTVCSSRQVAVYGSRVAADGSAKSVYSNQVGTAQDTYEKYISVHTFELPAAGEYYIVAEGGDICFTYVRLEMLRTAGEGIEKVEAPAGTDEVAKISISTATENYKQSFTLGDTFSVSSEYTIKGIISNNITGAVASSGAITEGITYWLGETELIPGTSTMNVLGNNTITVKVGNLSSTYTVVVDSAVDGITGATAKISEELNTEVVGETGTALVKKSDIVVALEGTSAADYTPTYTVTYGEGNTELTEEGAQFAIGTHTIKVAVAVSDGTNTATFNLEVTLSITQKIEGAPEAVARYTLEWDNTTNTFTGTGDSVSVVTDGGTNQTDGYRMSGTASKVVITLTGLKADQIIELSIVAANQSTDSAKVNSVKLTATNATASELANNSLPIKVDGVATPVTVTGTLTVSADGDVVLTFQRTVGGSMDYMSFGIVVKE